MNEVSECNIHDLNDHGFCRICGYSEPTEPRTVEPFHLNGKWPRDTWFQNRKRTLMKRELE